MMAVDLRTVSPGLLETVRASAWNVESMDAHGAEGRKIRYIGSEMGWHLESGSRIVVDYYSDEQGDYWYRDRVKLPDGEIVSMEKYLFGRELKRNIRRKTFRKR